MMVVLKSLNFTMAMDVVLLEKARTCLQQLRLRGCSVVVKMPWCVMKYMKAPK